MPSHLFLPRFAFYFLKGTYSTTSRTGNTWRPADASTFLRGLPLHSPKETWLSHELFRSAMLVLGSGQGANRRNSLSRGPAPTGNLVNQTSFRKLTVPNFNLPSPHLAQSARVLPGIILKELFITHPVRSSKSPVSRSLLFLKS